MTIKRCNNCGGQMEKQGDTWVCIQCGRSWQGPKVRHKFIENHKDEIIKDFNNMTLTAMLNKWSISISGWWKISQRWNLSPKIAKRKVATDEKKIGKEREELLYLRGYKQCLSDLLTGNIEIVLRIVDSTPVLTNNKK